MLGNDHGNKSAIFDDALSLRSKQQYACVRAWRVTAKISESLVRGHEQLPVSLKTIPQLVVRETRPALCNDRRDFMAGFDEGRADRSREILI